jgi:hypothetical protein
MTAECAVTVFGLGGLFPAFKSAEDPALCLGVHTQAYGGLAVVRRAGGTVWGGAPEPGGR